MTIKKEGLVAKSIYFAKYGVIPMAIGGFFGSTVGSPLLGIVTGGVFGFLLKDEGKDNSLNEDTFDL